MAKRRDHLAECHPALRARAERVLAAMTALGFPMLITDGVRTADEQLELWKKGRVYPGKTVTDCDGTDTVSPHQSGRALDLCFLDQRAQPTWDLAYPWEAYGECVKAVGLIWGGDWKRRDCPHMELPARMAT